MILPDGSALKSQVNQFRSGCCEKCPPLLDLSITGLRYQRIGWAPCSTHSTRWRCRLDHAAAGLERRTENRLADCQASLTRPVERDCGSTIPSSARNCSSQRLTDLHRRLLSPTDQPSNPATIPLPGRPGCWMRSVRSRPWPGATPLSGRGCLTAVLSANSGQVAAGDRIDVILHEGYLECLIEKTGQGRLQRKS